MWSRKHSVTLSIVICFVFSVILTVGLFLAPWALKMWFTLYRGWVDGYPLADTLNAFKACFYPSSVFAYITLYSLIRLLFNIRNDEIFIPQNVTYLRRISWCCFVVAVITLIGGLFYLPIGFIGIATGFVGLMLRIVKNVMQAAVCIREENDLTI